MSARLLFAEGLSLRFGSVVALSDVSLDLHPGEVVAIVSVSGSGKATLLRVLSGQIVPDSGRVLYRGKDIASLGEPALRRLADAQLTGLCPPEPARWAAHSVLAGGNVGNG